MKAIIKFLKENIRTIIKLLFSIVVLVIVFLVLKNISINYDKVPESNFLLTYLGLFIGFAITIYTFGISIMNNIAEEINNPGNELSEEKKTFFYNSVQNGFKELKWDIIITTYFFIIVLCLSFISNIKVCISCEEKLISELYPLHIFSVYITILILSLFILFDLMKTMFNISEILLILLKKKHRP